jgi:hypothetical protein
MIGTESSRGWPKGRLGYVAIAVAVAAVAGAGVAAAGQGGGGAPPAKQPGTTAPSGALNPVQVAAEAAVQQLVSAGTIDATQAHAIDAAIESGGINTDALVASGTLSQSQADAVQQRLGAVKQSFGPGGANAGEGDKGGGGSRTDESSGAPAGIVQAADAAMQQLVADGTIDQAQARAVDAAVASGSVDPAALVSNGTLSQAQMTAVAHRLDAVKQSFAGGGG